MVHKENGARALSIGKLSKQNAIFQSNEDNFEPVQLMGTSAVQPSKTHENMEKHKVVGIVTIN